MKNNKCVYIYLDQRKPGKYIYDDIEFDFEPIYVGKGNANRPNRHKYLYDKNVCKFYSKIKSILNETNIFPKYIIYKDNLSEEDANNEEIRLISKIDRFNGPLTNMSDGGEGQSGWKMSEETKKKKSIAMLGKTLGPLSKETKKKISIAKTGKNGKKGWKHSEKTLKKMSLKAKKRTGEKNSMFGKIHSEESKNKMSKNTKKLYGENNPNYNRQYREKEKTFDTWELKNKNTEIKIVKNLNKFCKENNLNSSCMRDISYGRQKSHKGWINVKKLTNNVKKRKN